MPVATNQPSSRKYLPCLLTRLTDEQPFSETDEGYDHVYSPEQLKSDILLNMEMLLNSHTAPAETEYLTKKYPEVAASGYHYGIDSCAGNVVTAERSEIIAQRVRRAIELFEPRLDAEETHVVVRDDYSKHDKTAVHLDIFSRLAVRPLDQEVFFRLRVDVETGKTTMNP